MVTPISCKFIPLSVLFNTLDFPVDTLKTIPVQNAFLQELLEIWSEVNFCDQIRTEQQFLEQPIWHNSLIRIEDKPVFYRQLFLCGISKITPLMKDSRNFLSARRAYKHLQSTCYAFEVFWPYICPQTPL